jgi:ATP-dependent DNA ligase
MSAPFADRRARLVDVLTAPSEVIHVTRTTTDPALAQEWFETFEGAGLDGVIAKPLGAAYSPNGRTMIKIKQARTVDVVVAGYRLHKNSTPETPLLGSLLLGLYDADGHLAHIGVSASFTAAKRKALIEELKPLEEDIENHPWGEWARMDDRQSRPRARDRQPVERREGPQLHPPAARTCPRSGLRPHGGAALPPYRPVQAVAPGSRPTKLHL